MCVSTEKGKAHDLRIYKESKVHILSTIKMQLDAGYEGIEKLHANSETPKKATKKHPLTKKDKKTNHILSKSRIVVENVIGTLKVFKILAERYRNRRKKFGLRLNLIAAICNLQLKI